jgi:hypothetical protein
MPVPRPELAIGAAHRERGPPAFRRGRRCRRPRIGDDELRVEPELRLSTGSRKAQDAGGIIDVIVDVAGQQAALDDAFERSRSRTSIETRSLFGRMSRAPSG